MSKHKVLIFQYIEVEDGYYGGSEMFPYNVDIDRAGLYMELDDEEFYYWKNMIQWHSNRAPFIKGSTNDNEMLMRFGMVEVIDNPENVLENIKNDYDKHLKEEEERRKKNQERAARAKETKHKNKVKKLSSELGITEQEVEDMLKKKG